MESHVRGKCPQSDLRRTRATFEVSVPRAIFDARVKDAFHVSKDGRFLMAVPVEQSAALPFTVELNWQAGLKK